MKEKNNEWFELSWEDTNVITEELQLLVDEIKKALTSRIPQEYLAEQFINEDTVKIHFQKHCLAGENKVSKKTNVYYDFNSIDEYRSYEQQLSNIFNNSHLDKNHILISSLYNTNEIKAAFSQLLSSETYILFSADCSLFNNKGKMALGLHSFANSVTTNYKKPTLDFNVLVQNNDNADLVSVSLFPLDLSQLEHTFNNFVDQHCEYINIPAIQINKRGE